MRKTNNRGIIDLDYLRQNIDYTNVKPDASSRDIQAFCAAALRNHVKTIYVPPVFTSKAVSLCGSDVDVGTTAGFPYGNMPVELKESALEYAAGQGARWVDVCLNISFVKSGEYPEVEEEVGRLASAARENKIGFKLIIESPYLSEEEIAQTAAIVDSHGVDYLKTSTGVRNKVTEKEIMLIKPLLHNSKLKAAGGITTLDEALRFFELGADKIGSSFGFEILEEALRRKM